MNAITNNDLSFKSGFKTQIKGLDKLGKKFQEISKGRRGTLSIYREDGELFATDGKSSVYVGDELSKYLAIANPTKNEITNYAKKAFNTLKLLQAETSYKRTSDLIKKNNTPGKRGGLSNSRNAYQRKINELYSESLAPTIFEDLRGAI